MRRYLAASLIIGAAAAGAVLLLWQAAGWWLGPAEALGAFYQRLGLVPPGAAGLRSALAQWLAVPVAALLVAWCTVDIPRPALKLVAVCGIGFVLAGVSPSLALFSSTLALSHEDAAAGPATFWLFEPFSGLAAGALAFLGGLAYGNTEAGGRKRVLHSLMGARLSEATLARWVDAPGPLPLKGEPRELTVVRCRIFNMGELQDKLDAGDLVRASNEYLRAAGEFLLARGAFLDECAPDGLRAVFGLPDSDRAAADACEAALELRRRLVNLSTEHESRWNLRPQFGVGLASGDMAVGLFGSTESGRLGVVGALLEKSRRLCDANERLGSQLLIDARTHQLAGDQMEVRPLQLWRDETSGRLQECFELLAAAGELDDEARQRRDQFWQGVIRLREGRSLEALECFAKARDPDRPDPVLERMAEAAEELLPGRPVGSPVSAMASRA